MCSDVLRFLSLHVRSQVTGHSQSHSAWAAVLAVPYATTMVLGTLSHLYTSLEEELLRDDNEF